MLKYLNIIYNELQQYKQSIGIGTTWVTLLVLHKMLLLAFAFLLLLHC